MSLVTPAIEEAIQQSISDSIGKEENLDNPDRRIFQAGLTVRSRVKGDGNCFFRAISDQLDRLSLDQKSHYEVRQMVVNYLRSNPFTVR